MSKHNYSQMYDKRVDEVKEEAPTLEGGEKIESIPVVEEEKIKIPTVTDTPKVLTVTGSPKVRLRSQADASSNVLLILNEGTDVTGLKQVGDWWLIRVGKQEGYMMAKYLK